MTAVTCPARPVLRYHGGKWLLAPRILAHFPPHRIYVEGFGGAASILMRKPRAYSEVYNDRYSDVVRLFRVLRSRPRAKELERLLRLTPYAREEFAAAYEETDDPVEAARRLVIRSFMGFGSGAGSNSKHQTGFRANSNRSGTTPAHDWANYPDALKAMTARLQGVVIESRDACKVFRHHDGADTLHYADPPYPHSTRTLSSAPSDQVYAYEMTDAQHEELLRCLLGLKGMVEVSSYPNDLYRDLLCPAGWKEERFDTHADGARDRVESLWLNPLAQETLARQNLQQVLFKEEAA